MTELRPHLLVVDDSRDFADTTVELLRLWGYEAEGHYCGASALAAVLRNRPTVILLDIGMSPMNGFVFAGHLREIPGCERTAVIAISGYTTEVCRERGCRLGIDHYLFKPADPGVLRRMVGLLMVSHERVEAREFAAMLVDS